MIQKTSRYRENGLSSLVILPVLLALAALIVVAGYLVYQRSNTRVSTKSGNNSAHTLAGANLSYSGNKAMYTSKDGGFILSFPKTWAVRSAGCAEGLILLGANANSVGSCGSEGFGQMAFSWEPVRTGCGVTPAYYTDILTQTVVASGVSGTRLTAIAAAGAGVPIGTKIEQYCYIRNGIMYAASYNQGPNYPDVRADFENMMTAGLTFN